MHYLSTRGAAPKVDFRGALLAGLASDGGLYVPESLPQFSPADIAAMARLSYPELALAILTPFVGDAFAPPQLKRMIDHAYGGILPPPEGEGWGGGVQGAVIARHAPHLTSPLWGEGYCRFRHAAIAPLTQLSHDHFLLELFHGPTLAFKDFALQLVGQMLEAVVADAGQRALVLGATSGDTGSAAMAGCAGRKNLDIVILYPAGRTSEVQRRQMTTLTDANIHPLAVEGTFDDCQDIVKTLFADAAFRAQLPLLAVNSINIARVLAQTVYYFYAALALGAPARRVNFTVPTGNFGDIYAGYLAHGMGLPVGTLTIATNRNDILARCVATGEYAMQGVTPTLSPSMDIEISSNFERLLFDLYGRDGAALAGAMQQFRTTRTLRLTPAQHADFTALFAAHACDDAATLATMREVYAQSGLLLDPHTATGVAAPRAAGVTVTLATAHPAKFPDAVQGATGIHPPLPAHLADLYALPERIIPIAGTVDAVKAYVAGL